MQEIQFEYFRGMEAEKYSFYRVPKVLFTADCFQSLSCEAKVLYGLMLDRMGLSLKNRWFDEEGKVYIIFTVEEVMELLCCKTQKAVKLMKELDTVGGIGLIEKKRLGLGKPNVIYVKNFILKEMTGRPEDENIECEACTDMQNFENQNSGVSENAIQNQEKWESQSFENQNPGLLKIENPDFRNSKLKSFENQNSGLLKIKTQEFRKSKCNKTDFSDIDFNDTEFSKTKSIQSYPIKKALEDRIDVMDRMETYRNIIRENISYECFQDNRYFRQEEVDELVELIVEVMLMPDNSMIRIAYAEKPVAIVKNRFMKLNQQHIEYVIGCLQNNTSKVGNIKSYLLTALYNAALTIANYYQAEVNHDMYGCG